METLIFASEVCAHSVLVLLKKPSTFAHVSNQKQVLVRLSFQSSEKDPKLFHCEQTKRSITVRFLQRRGLWLLMMGLLLAALLYTLTGTMLSVWKMVLKSSCRPGKRSLILVQVVQVKQKSESSYWVLFVFKSYSDCICVKEYLLRVVKFF